MLFFKDLKEDTFFKIENNESIYLKFDLLHECDTNCLKFSETIEAEYIDPETKVRIVEIDIKDKTND